MAEQDNSPPTQAPATPAPAKRRRWLRALGWTFAAALLTVILAIGSLLWWIGKDDSLHHTLQRVAGWLPANQTLVAKEVTGSVKNGGHIGWLQWQSPTMKVEVNDAKIGWQFRPLIFSRSLKLGEVHIAQLRIASTPDPEKKPSEPLQSLTLPVKIELPFKVDNIIWQGPPETIVQNLSGNYQYTGSHHELKIDTLQVADGHYQMLARIQGAAPMQTKIELQGKLQTPNPLEAKQGSAAPSLIDVLANAQIDGTLATEAAKLKITAHAEAEVKKQEQPALEAQAMLADIEASIAPWKTQPIMSAKAFLKNLDIAAFLPQGPRTSLSGELTAGPGPVLTADSASAANQLPQRSDHTQQTWVLSTAITNALPGPWDKQRLPLQQLQAKLNFDGGQWLVDEGQIGIGKGQVNLTGRYIPVGQMFDGKLQVTQLNPADILSNLEAAPLNGSLQAETLTLPVPLNPADQEATQAAPAVAFSMDLHAAGKPTGKALRIQTLAANGQWQAPLLQLKTLELDALQAKVNAQSIEFNTESQQAKAQLKASIPGAQLSLDGQMAPTSGKVQSQLQLSSLSSVSQWLRKLPGIKDPLAGAKLDGSAQLQLALQGGWQNLLNRLNAAHGSPIVASGLQVQAKLQGDKIRYQAAGTAADQALVIPALQLALNGSPENAKIDLIAQAQQAGKSVQINTAVQAGLATGKDMAPLDWQASLQTLQAQLKPGSAKPGPWAVQLQPGAPVQITQRTSGNTVLNTVYQFSAGKLQITPPKLEMRRTSTEALSPAQLAWDESSITRTASGAWGVRSAGRALGIPLAWVDAFSMGDDDPPLEAAGLSGDLSFNGRWNLDTLGKNLKADITVERAAGDLRLAVDDGSGTTVVQTTGPTATRAGSTRTRKISGAGMRARIKDVSLNVQAQGSQVTAKLLWDSERAGTINADLRTQLSYQQGGWALPGTSALTGQLRANMPDIGILALFAPPGWRIQGTLAADATISGTVQDPQWQGNIKADTLSIQSLLDGIDLRDGLMHAKLQGTRFDISDLRFKGGKGSQSRILGYSGNLTSAPEDGGTLVGTGYAEFTPAGKNSESGLSMNLQAKASKLQVLVRADRQVSVSGDLLAKLEQGQFTLRGDLTVDRASIILPEESAPSLDKDVVVRSAASRKAEEEERLRSEREARKEQARATPRKVPDILVKLNMGRDFALQGFGISTRLRGELEVKGASYVGGPPSVTGEIRTEQGRYRAWGQSLNVENGLIRFNGPYNNPSLDILALRPNIAVKAGVQVLGTASAPRVLLYSDPDLPDAEKLSWVVMGRDPATGGASSALLQQAAMALLAGGNSSSSKIAGNLGLDEVGFKGGGDGSNASGAALTMGKRLSDKLYLTYEQSLSGAMGIIYIFYDLSRSVTLRAQTGMTSAMDIVYTLRKD
ncbi:translocation/assembly module TamB domain-containing protein [Comamonas sp. Y33R10-2]|uniref:translocation/assembly module TamB domain-containing protein n=1 Tax=Comamonas sp. Y33R10-2 TaxID=2853257 RepID=UPI001C5C8986|nr:translocation/assembly module TamB domain-containing protein [Comamonas sp. Y33R10-2]QXZ09484.1 translocation/assembly module TamB domain-containing protein [Comamonas sp. Y33R10-2]